MKSVLKVERWKMEMFAFASGAVQFLTIPVPAVAHVTTVRVQCVKVHAYGSV